MKILLVGHPSSQVIVPASKYLTAKYLPGFDVTYLNYTGPIEGWAAFVRSQLVTLTDKYIIFSLDDYLIAGPIDKEKYRKAENVFKVNSEVVCVKLCQSTWEEHKEYPCTTQYTIWDREYLIWLLSQVQTPWEFELHGSKIFTGVSYLEPCLEYFTNSSLSSRWEGINLTGLKSWDIKVMQKMGLLPMEGIYLGIPANQQMTAQEVIDYFQKTGTFLYPQRQKAVTVFGGSGFLGYALVERLVGDGKNVTVVARNEGNLVALKEKFPSIQIMVGDIADSWIVKKAMVGADEAYLLSALKHVGLAEVDVKSCIQTNIVGTMNVINESLVTKPKVLVFVSSDKAAQPNGVYGCSKKIGEKLMLEAERINPNTKYRVVRYANVFGSTGSVTTKWKPKMEKGEEVILTDPEASRFYWSVQDAVDLIFESIQKWESATPHIPKMDSIKMGTVLEACMDVWGKSPVKIIGLQPGENKVETTDGIVFSDQCRQLTKEEFINKFLANEKDR